jgi:spermidine synthase
MDTMAPESGCAKRWILIAIGALGVSAVMTQLALMREMLGAFAGNEMVLGILLGNWLLLTGLGSWLGRTSGRLRNPLGVLILALILVAILPLAQVLLLRALRNVVFLRGAMVGVTETVVSSFVLLSPYCIVSGYLLTLACSMLGQRARLSQNACDALPGVSDDLRGGKSVRRDAVVPDDAAGIGSVYVADCIGSVAGGVLFTFVFVRWLDHLGMLCAPALLNLGLAAVIAFRCGRSTLLGIAALAAAGVAALSWSDMDAFSTALQFPQQKIVFRASSPYGKLLVTESAGQYDFIENGVPLFSTNNCGQIEETVHYAMIQRPAARKVLLVSGGVSGTAREILKYGFAEVTYVELDPLISETGSRFLPGVLTDPRIKVVNTDGRLFIKRTRERYDVIIVDMPDPSTSQINRFHTAEFFSEVRRVLSPDGVLSFALGRYENYVSPALARMLASAHRTLQTSFRNVLLVPGGRIYFLASDDALHSDIAARIEAYRIPTRLVQRNYLDAMLTPDRMADMRRAVTQPAAVNTDFNPVMYYYHLLHWISQFKVSFGVLEAVLLVAFAIYLLRMRAVPLAIFASGFAASALEVVLLLGCQILYGSLYQQLGVIVTMFMAGLATGAWLANRRERESPDSPAQEAPENRRERESPDSPAQEAPENRARATGPPRSCGADARRKQAGRRPALAGLSRLAFTIAAFAVLLPLALMILGRLGDTGVALSALQWSIPLLAFMLAVLVGMEFPLAGQAASGGAATTSSRLYTADFVGAFLGALLASTLLIPLFGVTAVCWLAAALNVLAGIAVWWQGR